MKKLILQLENLTCPSCVQKIEGALRKADGVVAVHGLFHSGKVKVSYEEELIFPDELKRIVTNLGYSVLNIRV